MQTVNGARYTFWHIIIDIANSSGLSKDVWCRENKISIRIYEHFIKLEIVN